MNLLHITDTTLVEKTDLSRKLTLAGITKAYPVYRVRLDQVFYNDQNDRIATWITQYKNDSSNADLSGMTREQYNDVIEKFIIESNPGAIEKTRNNIALVNQREPGVILSDGRIIDGNRRFTCLRLLNKESASYNYFETVILDESEGIDPKAIKMLELAIQHGEEQRVDYNLIDFAVGSYHDIIETKLLTVEEYAASTNETVPEVKKRLEVAKLINEFLEYMKVPGQYHIAREMQVYSVFNELVPLLKRCETEEARTEVKTSVFNNVMMGSFADHRKYIRQVKEMMDSGLFTSYIKKQKQIHEELSSRIEEVDITKQSDIQEFVKANEDITEELQVSMDKALLSSRKAQTKSKPSKLITQSISTLMDVDTRIIDGLSTEEKEKIGTQLEKLKGITNLIGTSVCEESEPAKAEVRNSTVLAAKHIDEPYVYCVNEGMVLNNLAFTLEFTAYKYTDKQKEDVKCLVFFVDGENREVSSIQEIDVKVDQISKATFSLNSSVSELTECYLVIKSVKDEYGTAQQMVRFSVNMAFSVGFDF